MTSRRYAADDGCGLALRSAARHGEPELRRRARRSLPAPIYTTDADGWVTFFNQRLHRLRRANAGARRGPLVRDLEA